MMRMMKNNEKQILKSLRTLFQNGKAPSDPHQAPAASMLADVHAVDTRSGERRRGVHDDARRLWAHRLRQSRLLQYVLFVWLFVAVTKYAKRGLL